jgi:phosphoribosylformylglycinamidine synthase
MEKLLLEACLEVMKTDALIGIQDMGAAGLTCSTSEMGSRGGAGVEIDVSLVPQRESGMTPYEIMLSESQERMLMVVKQGREAEVEQIFEKWDLHAVRVGEVTTDGKLRVKNRGEVVAEIPNGALTDEAPVYRRPMAEPAYLKEVRQLSFASLGKPAAPAEVFRRLLASPTIASKRWVYRQYDHMVRTNTLVMPGMGAGVVRVKGTNRALAMSVDCNGRFVYLDPFAGAQLAVAEAARNVACAGGVPIGATNCLNFGNPERPEIMWQFAKAVEGMGAACRALDIPITGGNVSLYNETDGRGVLPTPVLGVVGLIEEADTVVRRAFQAAGDVVIMLGDTRDELGGSEYLKVMHGLIRGVPPALDLGREAALHRVLIEGAATGMIRSAQDCSEGGFAVTLAECCIGTGLGADVEMPGVASINPGLGDIPTLFSESASRVIVSVAAGREADLLGLAARQGVSAGRIGLVGGSRIRVAIDGRRVLDEPLNEAEQTWATAIERYFEPARAIA